MEGNYHFWALRRARVAVSRHKSGPTSSLPSGARPTGTDVSRSRRGSQRFSPGCFVIRDVRWTILGSPCFWYRNSVVRMRTQISRQVRMYCFRFGNCGTFIPLSGVRSVSRIAVVWTRFLAAISASSSIHINALFTHSVILSAVDCE